MIEVVSVNGANMKETQFLKHGTTSDETTRMTHGALDRAINLLSEFCRDALGNIAHTLVGFAGGKFGKIGAHCTNGLGYRHVIVIEDDNQTRVHGTGIVQSLERHAGRHRAIADYCNHMVCAAIQITRNGHAEARGDGCRGVCGTKRIIFTFSTSGETRETVFLAQSVKTFPATCENFMGIGLMADIPDNPVFRCIEDVVQGDCEFNHAKASPEMTTSF